MALNNDISMRRVQSLIKGWLLELEETEGWKNISPQVGNVVRKAIVRTAWGAYKLGIITEKDIPKNEQ